MHYTLAIVLSVALAGVGAILIPFISEQTDTQIIGSILLGLYGFLVTVIDQVKSASDRNKKMAEEYMKESKAYRKAIEADMAFDKRVYSDNTLYSNLETISNSYFRLIGDSTKNSIFEETKKMVLESVARDFAKQADTQEVNVNEVRRMMIMKQELASQEVNSDIWAVNNEDITWWKGPEGIEYFKCNEEFIGNHRAKIQRVFIVNKEQEHPDKGELVKILKRHIDAGIPAFVISKDIALSKVNGFYDISSKSWFVTERLCGWSIQDASGNNITSSFVSWRKDDIERFKDTAIRLKSKSQLAEEYVEHVLHQSINPKN